MEKRGKVNRRLSHFEEKQFMIISINFHCIMLQSYQKIMYLLLSVSQFIFEKIFRKIANNEIKGETLTRVNFFSRKQIKL